MPKTTKHRWTFRARFRRHAFGWRSAPAVRRVKEAVSEIRKVARKDPVLAGEGAVLFLEKVSPALEHVDSSSGALGSAVNSAIETFVTVLADAPVADEMRDQWMERLWVAYQEDAIPYIEHVAEFWGELCVTRERASLWADRLLPGLRASWSDRDAGGYYRGTPACLSCLLAAGRHQELLDVLEGAPFVWWHDRRYGFRALVAMGRRADAVRYAEASQGRNDSPRWIASACEEVFLSSGMAEEAYRRYALLANHRSTHLATYRTIARKYPHMEPADILRDLVESTPGEEGKWFAAAKAAGLYETAIEVANASPCDPRTLTRAARDFAEKRPDFAREAGVTALRWLVEGYGYEITGADVWAAYRHALQAAAATGQEVETKDRILALVLKGKDGFVTRILGEELSIPVAGDHEG